MKSSLILGAVLLLTIAYIAQARKAGCITCGGSLGSGTNPCTCGDVVVKAAKVHKPLYHATPEAINEAASAREVAQLMSSRTFPGNVASYPQYSQTNGLYDVNSDISHSSSSSSHSSSASSSSSVDLFGGSIGRDLGSFYPFSQRHTHNSGCGSKAKMSLELSDLLLPNTEGKVMPRFPPIGDMCDPTEQVSYEVSTKVTPAYPKLNFYRTLSTPLCVNAVNGQIDRTELQKLASATSYSGITGLGVLDESIDGSISGSVGGYPSGGVGAASSLGGYSANVASNSLGFLDWGWGASNKYLSQNLGSNADILGERYNTFDSWYRPSSTGTGFSGQQIGSIAQSYAGSNVDGTGANFGASSFGGFDTAYGNVQGPIERSRCTDFGDDLELPEDYSYPRQPADAVSLTLAYKNLFPHTAVYNKKWFVPEDKLAFGHRTVPVEWRPTKKPSDIPEERLQILDKPIVELKPMAPIPVSVGVYDEQEEAKLAELETIERERINQEENARQPQGSFITYGDLGYAPVDGLIVPGKLMRPGALYMDSEVGLIDAEDAIGEGCGPLGPPVPGYVPGSIMVNREVVEIEGENEDNSRRNDRIYFRHYLDDVSDEEDDVDDATSGIFAKLKNVAQKYGPVTYPR